MRNLIVFAVKVYKCSEMAENCGSCLTLEQKFNCGWCAHDCTIEKQCDINTKSWLDHSSDCPNPTISGVSLILSLLNKQNCFLNSNGGYMAEYIL